MAARDVASLPAAAVAMNTNCRRRSRLEVGIATLIEIVVGIAHRVGPRAPQHHLKVDRLEAVVHITVDHARRTGDAFPRRSEERRVGKEGGRPGKTRWWRDN